MAHPALDPLQTAERIASGGDATYVDVRPVADFVKGHPKGRVINVPVEFYHPRTGFAHANESFVLVLQHTLANDTPVVVGGDADGRTERAADLMVEAGFTDVSVMSAGLIGWRTCGLAVTGNNADGVSYVSLLTPAKRAATPSSS